jgi:pyridoxamine 5'-phosphate oxidase
MSRRDPIPPSPTEADYQALDAEAGPLTHGEDPFAIFLEWLGEAGESEPNDPNAMAVATADEHGLPDVRMVLLKGVDDTGFVFYTNLDSAKGRQLLASPKAALLFHWKTLRRQVRVRGQVERVTDAEADAYFATRARAAQIGAWASAQSQPMEGPLALEKSVARYGLKFGLATVPRPPHWSGFRVVPETLEFWRSRRFRLHERLLFARAGGGWASSRLYP